MKRLLPWLVSSGCLMSFAVATEPASQGRIQLISPVVLHADYSRFVILDARELKDFRRAHLPGSKRVDWKDWTLERPNLWNSFFGDPKKWGVVRSDSAQIEQAISLLGISNDTPIVVVGAPHGWGEEGRIAWNLLFWGADDVSLLDGGFPAWVAEPTRLVEKGSSTRKPPTPGEFKVKLRSARRAEIAEVKAAVMNKTRPLLDARAKEEFDGKVMSGQKRGGHLPGATVIPVQSLYTSEGNYISARELEKFFAVTASSRPIAYCVGGVRSALLALLLEIRFHQLTANYDGSLWEWAAYEHLPLVKPGSLK